MARLPSSSKGDKAWWDELLPHVGGDMIVGKVGSGAKNVAVGKNIQQTIDSTLGPPTPNDKKTIVELLDNVSAEITKQKGKIDPKTLEMAEFQIKLLGDELKKIGKEETPSSLSERGIKMRSLVKSGYDQTIQNSRLRSHPQPNHHFA